MEEKKIIEFDDQRQEGLDMATPKEIEAPRPPRIIELRIVDSIDMADKQ